MLSRGEASDAVGKHGWRFLLGTLRTSVRVDSLSDATALATRAVEACGADADEHLRIDIRPDRVEFVLQTRKSAAVTTLDVELAHRITAGAEDRTIPAVDAEDRSVQELELAIDAMDIAAIRPFWKAVLGYTDEAGRTGPADPLVDPIGQGPAIWFQQMTEPRQQRNRIHLDLCVPHDEASARIAEALVAGGRLLSDRRAPSFWILADAEGNEICMTTWQGRD
ncbi:VOC family protein [Actinoplanes sp. NPDC023936]|uniref:VOC family protein n=1 Tax=Actinoplanes sp. NPDC023936 TaxID=3154910 RepID=UPI0033E582E1